MAKNTVLDMPEIKEMVCNHSFMEFRLYTCGSSQREREVSP